jgi:hypothetical protein
VTDLRHPAPKPKLVFFQYIHDGLPDFLVQHARGHVDCLSEFFDTTVVNSDCDYLEVCEKHEPDLALFELGVNHASCRRPRVANLDSCPSVPKLALHNADAFCNARAGFLSDLDRYGIATVFAIATTAAEHMPELADRLFVWPNCIDPAIYKDYGQFKSIPILLTGNKSALYPWRQRVTRILIARYPALNCPHPGYEPDAFRGLVLRGERYARTINASALVPTCGTVAKEVVRKHFEVPACRSCLVTERSPALEAAGFEDMKNCVFAEPGDIVDKLDYLLSHPDELQRITDAGHELVHSRHTLRQRNQILQWLELNRRLRPGERIVQPGPFAPLCVASRAAPGAAQHVHVRCRGLHLQLIEEGDRRFAAGDIAQAETKYAECINYMPWMPEPRVRLALCWLRSGQAARALGEVQPLLAFVLGQYRATDPDPIEWACYILGLVCLGKLKQAARRARQFPWVQHPELDRVRWLVGVLNGEPSFAIHESDPRYRRRLTIHVLPVKTWKEWTSDTEVTLRACGRHALAEALARALALEPSPMAPSASTKPGQRNPSAAPTRLDVEDPEAGRLSREMLRGTVRRRHLRRQAASVLHWLEVTWGPFLPFHFSILRRDPFYQRIEDIAREAQIGSALILGAGVGRPCTEAFLAGALKNEHPPAIYCVAARPRWGARLRQSLAWHPSVHWLSAPRRASNTTVEKLDALVAGMAESNGLLGFDAVIMDGEAGVRTTALAEGGNTSWPAVQWVFLNDINVEPNWSRHQWLLKQEEMYLFQADAGLRSGYSIFRRRRLPSHAGSAHGPKGVA